MVYPPCAQVNSKCFCSNGFYVRVIHKFALTSFTRSFYLIDELLSTVKDNVNKQFMNEFCRIKSRPWSWLTFYEIWAISYDTETPVTNQIIHIITPNIQTVEFYVHISSYPHTLRSQIPFLLLKIRIVYSLGWSIMM